MYSITHRLCGVWLIDEIVDQAAIQVTGRGLDRALDRSDVRAIDQRLGHDQLAIRAIGPGFGPDQALDQVAIQAMSRGLGHVLDQSDIHAIGREPYHAAEEVTQSISGG